jgi:hydrogenase-4 component B
MNGGLLILAWLTPLLMLPLVFSRFAGAVTVLAVLPALLAAVAVPAGTAVDIPWLLLGLTLHLDPVGATFLLFSSMIWLFAGLYGALTMGTDSGYRRFGVFFLVACTGNLLLILAADLVSFYVGFALMGLAATGLIAHRRSQHAGRAARVYLAWTLLGEMALFAAVVLLANDMASLRFADLTAAALPAAAATLLLFGFGIKLALPGLHVWLPLAYPASPAAAAAVLSGPMISAGLLGWLRFLPPGNPTLAGWGEGLLALGVIGAALGVLAGLVQRDPRTVLAYSSIAKMGMVTSVFSIALVRPDAAPGIVAALVVFTMHHLMLKGTLFLGIGEWHRLGGRPWLTVVLGILALALIGAPFTSGAGAKLLLTDATIGAGFDLALLFGFSTLGTLFLMARFIWLIRHRPSTATAGRNPASLVWLALAALAILLPLMQTPLPWSSSGLGTIAAGLGITAAFVFSRRWVPFTLPTVPPGDLLYLLRAAQRLWTGGNKRRQQQHFKLSPRALMSADMCRTAACTLGALAWLFIGVFLLAVGLLPG